jgi:tetratricopeptide (TPR) repeat protein
MKKIFVLLLSITFFYAKEDFYYSFVTPDLNQISQSQKREILNANAALETIKTYLKEGQLNIAYKQIMAFRNTNKVELLNSEAILLHSEILYKMETKVKAIEATSLLEKAIHDSRIGKEDLLEAYKLLVLLKIRVNKANEAQYYANAILHGFDDPSSKVYGKIAQAQIHIKRRDYRKAIKLLKKELIETNNLEVATIVADELYDAYILNDEHEKAYDLVDKVLGKNIDYYANDSYKALTKVRKLLDNGMEKFAITIIKRLLEKASVTDSIDNFKFILANTYMKLAGFEPEYMPQAKTIYEDLLAVREGNPYFKRSKMYLDEIIMREGKFDPQMIASKYSGSESMQQKAMMQELLNAIEDQKYEQIIRMKKIYDGINKRIVNRFGFKSMDDIYSMVNFKLIEYYLSARQCTELNKVMKGVSNDALMLLIEDQKATENLFACMQEEPKLSTYTIAKSVFSRSRNAEVYYNLEKVALMLKKYNDAESFSQKLDMLGESDILSKEFLYRFLIYGEKKSSFAMEKFFKYARNNREFISKNENNPLIIDFYYQYYLYLLKQKEESEAISILLKLYDKQNEMKARVYSPFVEIELAKYEKLDDNYDKALEYLQKGLNIKRNIDGLTIDRKIKKEDLAQIYYEMAKIYEHLGKQNKYKTMIKKCKNLKDVDSYYKKMCDRL